MKVKRLAYIFASLILVDYLLTAAALPLGCEELNPIAKAFTGSIHLFALFTFTCASAPVIAANMLHEKVKEKRVVAYVFIAAILLRAAAILNNVLQLLIMFNPFI